MLGASQSAGNAGAWIYDMDAHYIGQEHKVRAFMEEPYCHRSRLLPSSEWHLRAADQGSQDHAPEDLEGCLSHLQEEGVAYSLNFPVEAMQLNLIRDKKYLAAYSRAHNNFAADFAGRSQAFGAMAVLPFDNVPAAVEEVNRAITQLGLAGVFLSSYGLQEHIGSTKYWPIYEEIERLNVHLGIHNDLQGGPIGDQRPETRTQQHASGRPNATLTDCAALIFSGVVERFPKLRISFLESGCGWIPYWMEYMDMKFEGHRSDAPLLKAKPSEYLAGGNFFCSLESHERMVPEVLAHVSEDIIVLATDFPHPGCSSPQVVLDRDDLSERQKQKILRENGIRLLTGAR